MSNMLDAFDRRYTAGGSWEEHLRQSGGLLPTKASNRTAAKVQRKRGSSSRISTNLVGSLDVSWKQSKRKAGWS